MPMKVADEYGAHPVAAAVAHDLAQAKPDRQQHDGEISVPPSQPALRNMLR